VLLEVALPVRDGFAVLEEIRCQSSVPITLLTARGEELGQVRGLEFRADEYVVKPFSLLALLARLKALLRRVEPDRAADTDPDFVAGELTVNVRHHGIARRGLPVGLTPVDFRLLYHLVSNAGRVMPHHVLLTRVWGGDSSAPPEYLKIFMSRLCPKIEGADDPRHIRTVRGFGCTFVRPAPRLAVPSIWRGAGQDRMPFAARLLSSNEKYRRPPNRSRAPRT
jgi:DNA-binding response OmpR family regulator